jgi:ribosomal protein L11 methyltransferase
MDYIRLTISLQEKYHDYLIAELFDLEFEGFQEEDDQIIATIPASRFDDLIREEVEGILMSFEKATIVSEELIPPQNWNRTWEESIKPQTIGKFYVRPTWAPGITENEEAIELLIDPKMAFGTGYHATTRLILEWLPEIIAEKDKVLDAGTGTGILSIAALKLGASSAFGFDIDEWSKDNAEENMELNDIKHFKVELGSTEVIPEDEKYDVILANINRNALISLIPELLTFLKTGGKILLSGLLKEDEEIMKSIEDLQGLDHLDTRQQQEWIAMLYQS